MSGPPVSGPPVSGSAFRRVQAGGPGHCRFDHWRPANPDAPAWVKDLIEWGAGPRACQNLVLTAKVRAVLRGRFHVTDDDIAALALPVLRHRVVPTFNAEAEGIKVDDIIARIIQAVPRGEAKRAL